MTVMNNPFTESTTFSTSEIVAARNAFLQYEINKQVELLTVMPHEECMAVLGHCSVAHVHQLLDELNQQGHQHQANQYAHCLGLVVPHTSIRQRVSAQINQWRFRIAISMLIVLATAILSYLSVFVFV
ncbi:hypothetical protein [Salinivibrio kushneri]|uniref:Uncharacterized protein n=1 Tax=Salinivibrio kushneri TaxID=1908198 RepID=A0AA47KNS7_9GAMM|nr:hypothetical protein [Salinivibrio kushneri]WBA10370.1 hypothetical protein N8M53_13515 [Salinivibrio kushneri]